MIFKENKKEIKTEDTPSTSAIPETKFKPEILVDDKETNEQLMKKLTVALSFFYMHELSFGQFTGKVNLG